MKQGHKLFAADDWGLSPGINEGILALARVGLLRSVSCMGRAKHLEHGLAELLEMDGVEHWMHFDLTSAGFGSFLLKNAVGSLDTATVANEFRAQLGRLEDCGLKIQGFNGHHHVHLFAAVYDVILRHLGERRLCKLRMMRDRGHLPSYAQTKLFQRRRPDAGKYFSLEPCFYLRKEDLVSKAALQRKIARAGGAPLLSHPALYDDFDAAGVTDRLRGQRVAELAAILRALP